MPLINNDLADLLGSVKTPGDFHAAGVCAMHAPLLQVDGVGPIALPLLAAKDAWRRKALDAAGVSHLLRSLCRIDAALAEQAVRHWLAWPETYGLDSVIVPALRGLADRSATRRHTAYRRLCAAAVQHLQARAAQELAPPADWRRDANLACRCVHCKGLRQFLLSATEPSWRFKAKESDRDHVQLSVRQGQCDLDCTVERKGSPHVLVCTKNQASYEARVRQRKVDLEDLARLG